MKSKIIIGSLLIPAVAFMSVVAFHPGIAFAAPAMKTLQGPGMLQAAGEYTIDPMHTNVGFEISHLGLSRVQGRFDKVSGHVTADPKNLSKSQVTFTIEAASVDTNVAPRDADLKSPNFFDVGNFPEIKFVSTKVKKHGGSYEVEGDLSIHGVTKSVSIPFKQFGPIKDPWGASRAGIIADPFTINREDYGMHFDAPMVGSVVTIRISLEGTLDK